MSEEKPNGTGSVADQPIPVRILGALSCPRVTFTDPMFTHIHLVQMNIALRKHSGAYWEQSLSYLLYHAVEEGYDFVLTTDYDSVYKPPDVWYLLNLMMNTPEAAAIFGLQYRRGVDQLLVGLPNCNDGRAGTNRFSGHIELATKGHFGLTLIRVSALKQMPHPWLLSTPGANGRWDAPDKVDADIYFWKKMLACGLKFYNAPRCLVGHMQQMITWPGEGLKPEHQYVGDYFKDGDAPKNVIQAVSARAQQTISQDLSKNPFTQENNHAPR